MLGMHLDASKGWGWGYLECSLQRVVPRSRFVPNQSRVVGKLPYRFQTQPGVGGASGERTGNRGTGTPCERHLRSKETRCETSRGLGKPPPILHSCAMGLPAEPCRPVAMPTPLSGKFSGFPVYTAHGVFPQSPRTPLLCSTPVNHIRHSLPPPRWSQEKRESR